MPTLVCEHLEKDRRWAVAVSKDRFTLGRSRKADVCIPDLSVSKRHVEIERRGGRYYFRDLESKNGTFINELKSAGGPLHDGDVLRLGKVRVTFYKEAPPGLRAGSTSAGGATPAKIAGEGAGASGAAAAGADLEAEGLGETLLFREPIRDEVDGPPASGGDAEEAGRGSAGEGGAAAKVAEAAPRAARAAAPAGRRQGTERFVLERRGWPTPALVLAILIALLAGFVLGRWSVTRSPARPLDVAADPRGGARPVTKPPGGDRSERPVPPNPVSGRESAPGAPAEASAEAPAPRSPSGVPAPAAPPGSAAGAEVPSAGGVTTALDEEGDFADAEVSARALVRLAIDLLGRPPTRSEWKELSPLAPGARWRRLVDLGGSFIPRSLDEAAERFLGRPLTAAEREAIRRRSGGDPVRAAAWIARSRLYVSAEHRRPRGLEVLARSLWVDLLDRVPTAENVKTLLEEIRTAGGRSEAARILAKSKAAEAAAPAPGADLDAWIRETYARALLRFPTPAEMTASREVCAKTPDGWRLVLLELVLRPEYETY